MFESWRYGRKNSRESVGLPAIFMVGVTGFEPATSWTRTMRTTKLCHTPIAFLFFPRVRPRPHGPETISEGNTRTYQTVPHPEIDRIIIAWSQRFVNTFFGEIIIYPQKCGQITFLPAALCTINQSNDPRRMIASRVILLI